MRMSILGFTNLLPTIRRTTRRSRTQVQKQRVELPMLPSEILQHISNFLPVSSAVSFALCSRKALWLLGNQALHCLRSADQAPERRLFLTLLEKDLPDWLLCHHCTLFHPIAQDHGPQQRWRYMNEPECVRANGVVYITLGYRIQYQHAQLLINHYRFGRAHQINLEMLCHTLTVTRGDTNITTEIWGRIVLGELLVRATSKLRLPSSSNVNLVRHRIPEICPHLKGLHDRIYMSKTIVCRPCHAGRMPCVKCCERKSCGQCSTWFQMSGRELGNSGTEIQIDIWRYLGSCKTPFDAKWRNHTDPLCSTALKTSIWPGGKKSSHGVAVLIG